MSRLTMFVLAAVLTMFKLESAASRAFAKLEGEDEKRLVAAQRLGIKYRDANCAAERELYAGGTGGPRLFGGNESGACE